eukprot:3793545-Rhodomonas_salina.1
MSGIMATSSLTLQPMIKDAGPLQQIFASTSSVQGGVSSTCPLCHGEDEPENISHMLMHCPATEAARHSTHDRIADPLLASIAQASELSNLKLAILALISVEDIVSSSSPILPPSLLPGRVGPRQPSSGLAQQRWLISFGSMPMRHTNHDVASVPQEPSLLQTASTTTTGRRESSSSNLNSLCAWEPTPRTVTWTSAILRKLRPTLAPEYSGELITFVMTVSGSTPKTTWDHNFTLFHQHTDPPPRS